MLDIISIKYWDNAARAGFAKPDDWRSWADRLIIAQPKPPSWLIDLSLALDIKNLSAIIAAVYSELPDLPPGETDNAIIGYIWWRYEQGELSLRDCLEVAGQFADGSQSGIECEKIFDFLNQVDSGNPESIVEARAKEMFAPLRELAKRQWECLLSSC